MQSPETDRTPPVQPPVPAELDDRTRNRLLCAAVNVFDRKGYQAASVREIVEQAGVTKPALYYHFGNKEGLLVAILKQAASEVDAVMKKAVARPGTAREKLIALCEDMFGLFSTNVPVARVAHTVFLGPADAAPAFDFEVFERSMLGALGTIVKEGIETGEVRDADPLDVGLAILGVIGSVVGRQLHPGAEPVSVDSVRRVLKLVFDGVFKVRAEQGERA